MTVDRVYAIDDLVTTPDGGGHVLTLIQVPGEQEQRIKVVHTDGHENWFRASLLTFVRSDKPTTFRRERT